MFFPSFCKGEVGLKSCDRREKCVHFIMYNEVFNRIKENVLSFVNVPVEPDSCTNFYEYMKEWRDRNNG